MARIRSVKPQLFLNEDLAELEPLVRFLFIGLFCYADREGRLEDRPKRLKPCVLPYENCDLDALLGKLHDAKFITRYEVDGQRYIWIPGFRKHQKIHKDEQPSVIPPAPQEAGSVPPPQKPGADRDQHPTCTPAAPYLHPTDPPYALASALALASASAGVEEEALVARAEGAATGTSTPPPPAPQVWKDESTGKAAPERSPFVRQLWARCLETIVPPGAPREMDAANAGALEQLLARRRDAPDWYLARLFEMFGQIAKHDRYRAGGPFVIAYPVDLLKLAQPKTSSTKLLIDEVESKCPTALETPEQRAKRERSEWKRDRRAELQEALIKRTGRGLISKADADEIERQLSEDWKAREVSGPAPPPAANADRRDENNQPVKEG